MSTLVDTHITPLLLPDPAGIECIPAWGPKLEASATWLPEWLSDVKPDISATLLSLPPLILPPIFHVIVRGFSQIERDTEGIPQKVVYKHFCTAKITVNTDFINVEINTPKCVPKCVILDAKVSVRDVLHTVHDQSMWNNCILSLGPPSNIASPLAASDDPNVPYDWTPKFLEPGDWVDMGGGIRIECHDNDITIINDLHDIMKLNPSSIHGGFFEIYAK